VAVKMDPVPELDKLKENVSLNFRHLKVTTERKIYIPFCFVFILLKKFTKLN